MSRFLQRFRSRVLVTLIGVLALSTQIAQGANRYWDGTGTGWNTVSSWSTSSSATTPDPATPPSTFDIANFNISSVISPQTVNLNANQSAQGIVVNSSGGVTIQNGSGTDTLTVGTSGITLTTSLPQQSIRP